MMEASFRNESIFDMSVTHIFDSFLHFICYKKVCRLIVQMFGYDRIVVETLTFYLMYAYWARAICFICTSWKSFSKTLLILNDVRSTKGLIDYVEVTFLDIESPPSSYLGFLLFSRRSNISRRVRSQKPCLLQSDIEWCMVWNNVNILDIDPARSLKELGKLQVCSSYILLVQIFALAYVISFSISISQAPRTTYLGHDSHSRTRFLVLAFSSLFPLVNMCR